MPTAVRTSFPTQPYHLVSPSPWPILTCISLFSTTTSVVFNMHDFYTKINLGVSVLVLIFTVSFWFRDIISESTYLGCHTSLVKRGIINVVGLFIISEVFFFFSIFWTYFHSSLSPNIELGANWPPMGIKTINPFELPLLNTILLLASGVSVTYAHHFMFKLTRAGVLKGLFFTVLLATLFTLLQCIEYLVSSFTISDGIYGSCFYFGTGFHGLHVIIGTVFISVGLWRSLSYQLTENHHLGLESSILYWHFVDIVWIILYICVYIWGS